MIRTMNKSDLDTIMDIWLHSNIQAHDFIEASYWRDNFNEVKKLISEADVRVIDDEGIKGFIGIQEGYIAGIFISQDKRNKGYGQQLLKHVQAVYKELSLDVYRRNDAAVRFYLKHGFKCVKESMDEETKNIELHMLWKEEKEMIEIRQYENKDFKRICEIHDKARFNELKISGLESAFKPLEDVYEEEALFEYDVSVALIDENPVGFVAFSKQELGWIYVDPDYGRKGIGKQLLEYVLEQAESYLELEVISDNTSAINFYKKMGFEIVDEATGKMPGNEEFTITVYEMRYTK